ncbi:MAG: hypothetical protein OSA48_03855 [Akkermansiaceae bacterium]|nr:hypothetical protein [Akkermansiaceae bacterium]
MGELKKRLMEQLDLDELRSNKAIEIVLGFVKDKLPENLQGMVAKFMDDDSDGSDGGGAIDKLKGLLGGD